jgi:AcrR family transcriptional regulator
VAEALFEFVAERGALPAVGALAQRAGVSRRSVYRYFDGVAALELETAQLMRERLTRVLPPPEPIGQVSERLEAVLEHRATLYEHVAPVRRFLDQAAANSKPVAKVLEQARLALRAHLTSVFPRVARAGGPGFEALELATSWEAWSSLRTAQGLSVAEAKKVTRLVLRALLGV